jgi:hypothetical protein
MHDCNYENIKNLRIERVEARVRFNNITNCISETMKVLNGTSTAMVTIGTLKRDFK